jgi:hypothetical protein
MTKLFIPKGLITAGIAPAGNYSSCQEGSYEWQHIRMDWETDPSTPFTYFTEAFSIEGFDVNEM